MHNTLYTVHTIPPIIVYMLYVYIYVRICIYVNHCYAVMCSYFGTGTASVGECVMLVEDTLT